MEKIQVLANEISIKRINNEDYVSITDIARYKNNEHTDDLIRNWIRNRNTIEFLGIWESIYNPNFNPVEFDGFRKLAGFHKLRIISKK
jgi:hypothetical protein